jgi:hypothetical protein
MVSEISYKICQDLLFIATSKVGRYEALLEFALESLKEDSPTYRERVSKYLTNRLQEIKNEQKEKISNL